MRPTLFFMGGLVLLCAAAVALAIVWVDQGLAAVKKGSNSLCLTASDRAKITSGDFASDRKDTLVAKAINFDRGVTSKTWWHFRGAAIRVTYATFWRPSSRAKHFGDLVAQLNDCGPVPLG